MTIFERFKRVSDAVDILCVFHAQDLPEFKSFGNFCLKCPVPVDIFCFSRYLGEYL